MVKLEISARERARFDYALKEYSQQVEKSVDVAIRELAAVCARELAFYTRPWGLTAKVGKKFQTSITSQVYRAIRKGNIEGVAGDARTVHNHYRRDGKVKLPRRMSGQFKRDPVALDEAKALVARRVARAGAAKGAWIAAAADLGLGRAIRVPKWIKRHSKRGRADVQTKNHGSTVVLRNDVSYAGSVMREADIRRALKKGYAKQARRMVLTIKGGKGQLARHRPGYKRRR